MVVNSLGSELGKRLITCHVSGTNGEKDTVERERYSKAVSRGITVFERGERVLYKNHGVT